MVYSLLGRSQIAPAPLANTCKPFLIGHADCWRYKLCKIQTSKQGITLLSDPLGDTRPYRCTGQEQHLEAFRVSCLPFTNVRNLYSVNIGQSYVEISKYVKWRGASSQGDQCAVNTYRICEQDSWCLLLWSRAPPLRNITCTLVTSIHPERGRGKTDRFNNLVM